MLQWSIFFKSTIELIVCNFFPFSKRKLNNRVHKHSLSLYEIRFEGEVQSYQLKLIKMRDELANLNLCAVPFLSRAAVNLYWYWYTYWILTQWFFSKLSASRLIARKYCEIFINEAYLSINIICFTAHTLDLYHLHISIFHLVGNGVDTETVMYIYHSLNTLFVEPVTLRKI